MSTTSQSAEARTSIASRSIDRSVYERYLPIVRRIAMRIVRRLPRDVGIDEILSAGWLGLVEALRRRDTCPTEEQFEAYAAHRIRGAILDYMRSLDPMSRRIRESSRAITEGIRKLSQEYGRAPKEDEIAAYLGVDLDVYHELLMTIGQADAVRLELTDMAVAPASPALLPEDMVSKREMAAIVAEAIERLPERLQLVLALYYQEDCNLSEIGEVLGVSESRVSQLHTESIHRLRAHLDAVLSPESDLTSVGRKKRGASHG
jgi:RNA polymerase sigma factor for flagellar operon FliA